MVFFIGGIDEFGFGEVGGCKIIFWGIDMIEVFDIEFEWVVFELVGIIGWNVVIMFSYVVVGFLIIEFFYFSFVFFVFVIYE